jgi:putative hemolysin
MKKVLCNLEETFISISNFFKTIDVLSIVNMLEKVDYLIVICKNHKLGIQDYVINIFLKVFDILKKIVKDKKLLENKIFCDTIKEFTE